MGAPGSKAVAGSFVTFIISFLLIFLARLPTPRERWGSPLSFPFILMLPPSQVFIITCFSCGFWVQWRERQEHLLPKEEKRRLHDLEGFFPLLLLSAGMRYASQAVIYRLSISESRWEAERSPAFPHLGSSWVLELAESKVSFWECLVPLKEGPGFCQL